MASAGIKRPLEVDVDEFRFRTSTNFSSILTEGHFESACKHYRFSREPFPPPDILDIPPLHSLIEQLSLPLVQCIDLIRVKNEASLLPMVFEILKILCRLSSIEISPDARKKELSDEEQQLLILSVIRESELAPGSAGVDLLELLINWEEHFLPDSRAFVPKGASKCTRHLCRVHGGVICCACKEGQEEHPASRARSKGHCGRT